MPTLTLDQPISLEGWRETLIGGQCFRWRAVPDENARFRGQIDGQAVTLKLADSKIHWDNSNLSKKDIQRYLALDKPFSAAINQLPWRSDPQLKTAMDAYPGLRILRQPVEEALFCFLCSSVKTIPQIQLMLESVCRDFGNPLGDDQYAFPGWDMIAKVGEAPLRGLKLGYRAKYISQTATRVSPTFFADLKSADYPTAKAMLIALPGVGEKIADCVCLFGLHHLEAFPVDTWIAQAMESLYALEGWTLPQIAHFGRTHFGEHAGLAQQYLFSYMRSK
ncbi:MAG: DNA-3-methyladenine glycosylase family protein [Opitutales bacterium]